MLKHNVSMVAGEVLKAAGWGSLEPSVQAESASAPLLSGNPQCHHDGILQRGEFA